MDRTGGLLGKALMLKTIRNRLDAWLGRGDASIFVPAMDGALKANEALDQATLHLGLPEAEVLLVVEERLLASSGSRLMDVTDRSPKQLAVFDGNITALATNNNGRIAVATDNDNIAFCNISGHQQGSNLSVPCPTGLLHWDLETLIITSGSAKHSADQWRRDLLTKEASGGIFVSHAGANAEQILGNLAWPVGLARTSVDRLAYSEAWRHRICSVTLDGGQPRELLQRLPIYPGHILPLDAGYLLTGFGPRNQLIEFVLTEDIYRMQMLASIDESLWIAPMLRSGRDFREPLQSGGVKQMGVLKPWAPAFSCGIVIELDACFKPVDSFHSRADGHVHGTTSTAVLGGRIYVAAMGDGKIVSWSTSRTLQ